jgi:hypothetical protein
MGFLSGTDPKKAIFNMIRPFEDYFADELPDIIALLLNAAANSVLSAGFQRRNSLLQNSTLSLKDYESVIRQLSEQGYLSPILSIVWCGRHGKYPRTYLITGYPNSPRRVTCDLCDRTLKTASYLLPSTAAMIFVRRYEGALPALMAWDLERHEIQWNANVFLKGVEDTEKDLVFIRAKGSGVSIVECKCYFGDTNERVRKDNIKALIHQLERHVKSYVDRGIKVEAAIAATNYPVESYLESFVRETTQKKGSFPELSRIRFRLVGPGRLETWWRTSSA